MYTKENAKQNRLIESRAKELLTSGTDAAKIREVLRAEFPAVSAQRLRLRVDKAERELHGLKIRRRGGQPGNRSATKERTKKTWSARFDEKTRAKIIARSRELGLTQTAYVENLIKHDQ